VRASLALTAFVLIAAVNLAGCSSKMPTAQDVAAIDDAACRSYGAQPGTQAYFECRMAKDRQNTALAAAIIGNGGLLPAPGS
jgi:hypothetical protein